tara:strand:- start:6564 stop:7064 length:501 start_codon:yes stop_codon:yes gene_type:complete
MAEKIDHDHYTNKHLRNVLGRVKTIAMVGASANWNRPSYFVMKYLLAKDYTVFPVNPRAAGEDILAVPCYASLKDIPERVDMVDIFRGSAAAGPITDEALEIDADVIWMQISVRNDEAAAKAEAKGKTVIMNRCPKIEYSRLFGELSWGGFNSNVITAKRSRAYLR